MSYAFKNFKTFTIDENYDVICKWQKTSYGFRHLATLRKNGREIATGKGTYYNRTWERYTYQSAIYDAIRKADDSLDDETRARLNEWAKEGKEPLRQEMSGLGAVAMVAKLGDILCESQEAKNSWKKRMLGTVDGLDFPEDFDALPEDVKQQRLDSALKQIAKPEG